MESYMPRALLIKISVVMTMLIVLQTTSRCEATDDPTMSLKGIGNSTASASATSATASICVGTVTECLIAEQDPDDLELQMPSEISRRALATGSRNTQCKLNPKCIGTCGSTGGSCAGQRSKRYIGNCNNYNRNCH